MQLIALWFLRGSMEFENLVEQRTFFENMRSKVFDFGSQIDLNESSLGLEHFVAKIVVITLH